MTPAEIAARTLNVDSATIIEVERIKHGLTNESWLVRTDTDAVVVRISNTAEAALQIDRASETRILTAVAAAGIGPEVLLCDPARHVLVTRYLGETWTVEDATREKNIQRLASVLSRLHRLAVPSGVRHVQLLATVEGYLATLGRHGVQSDLTTAPLRARARQVAGRLREGFTACLCHNDVHHLNIVDAGELRLIDWEYAGVGERLFDLASVCVYHRYDKPQREKLLAAYLPQADPPMWHRLELACWLFDYIRELWTAVRETAGRPA